MKSRGTVRLAASVAVASIATVAGVLASSAGILALLGIALLAVLLLWGLVSFREWARRAVVVLGWVVSLLAGVVVATVLVLPAVLGESYLSTSSRFLLAFSGLWCPFLVGGLLGWLYFRRAGVRALFGPSA